jgi:hypothetical protein
VEADDLSRIAALGWRQGSILSDTLAIRARQEAPSRIRMTENDRLIVTSHPCDVVNLRLENEPVVEVLRAASLPAGALNKQEQWGRSPRAWNVALAESTLQCRVHDRWPIPRQWLADESPAGQLPDKETRSMAEWLAKRYVRPAFPSVFDERWASKRKQWFRLLERESALVQGVYVRVSTMDELLAEQPYRVELIVAVSPNTRTTASWSHDRARLETSVDGFWSQFKPGIECTQVDVLGMDEITFELIAGYQRFDADWISFIDDNAVIPMQRDFDR